MMQAAAIGAGVAAYCAFTDHEPDYDRDDDYRRSIRPRSPTSPRQPSAPQASPSPPRAVGRLGRTASMELPLNEYIARCCRDVVGTDGSPGIENHQAMEQIFFLQQDTIRALEDYISYGTEIDDRLIRRRAAAIRARTKKEVIALAERLGRETDFY